jgi:ATP-binding cassette subfamily B protein
MAIKRKIRSKLPKPKITFDRLGQITFTLKEVTKLAFKVRPKLLVVVFLLNAVWGISAVPGFYLEKLILDRLIEAINNPDWMPLFYSATFFTGLSLVLSLFRNFLSSFNQFLRRTLSRYFDAELNILMGNKIAQLDLVTIEDPGFRDKFNKIERESGRRAWGLMMPLSDIPNYLVGFLSAAAVLILVHPLVSIGVLIVSLPRLFINSRYIKKEYKLSSELAPKHRVWGWLNSYLVRNRNFMELKILRLSGYLTERVKEIVDEILRKQVELSKKREISGFIGFLPLTIYEFVISVLLIFWVIIGRITVGSFQLYLRSLRSAEQNLTGLVSSFLEIYENYIYVTDLVWFLNLEPEIEKKSKGIKLKEGNNQIILENIWFKYRDDQPWVLKDVDLKIEPSERVAIVGENGVGKSTLIKLIARFYDPQKGEVIVGSNDLKKLDLSQWRNKLGVLFQRFETYPFTARESIGYGDVDRIRYLGEIKEAAKKTGIDKYIESLPLGWDNPLAPEFEKGVHPSIGQWQRIGISRMLFRKNADILILDEPTSNVDPKAEEAIFNELLKITKGKILIFVSQRFSTVRRADRIFVMDKGRITEQGTHDQLMKEKGLYSELFTLQAKGYQ